jgi:hypothetical protein
MTAAGSESVHDLKRRKDRANRGMRRLKQRRGRAPSRQFAVRIQQTPAEGEVKRRRGGETHDGIFLLLHTPAPQFCIAKDTRHSARGLPGFSCNIMFLHVFFGDGGVLKGPQCGGARAAPCGGSPHRHDGAKMIDFADIAAMAGSNRSGKDFSFRDLPSGAYSRDVRLFLIPNY